MTRTWTWNLRSYHRDEGRQREGMRRGENRGAQAEPGWVIGEREAAPCR